MSQAGIDYASFYKIFSERVAKARTLVGRPLTYAEKILFSHLGQVRPGASDGLTAPLPTRKETYAALRPDRVAMQDATAQMALLQFMLSGKTTTDVPSTVHCDHLIQAHTGREKDLFKAFDENKEVYGFLESVSQKYGIGFWKPGAGIIHQVVLENYAFPGGMMLGTDSHTPNAGGLGMIAVGVGGADAVDVMVGLPFDVKFPGLIGVELTGSLSGWASPKDVILHLMGILTTKGGTGHIVEFFGPGTASLSCTGKATITNMGAEHGATTSTFPFDEKMAGYLRATGRDDLASLAEKYAADLRCDPEIEKAPEKFFDRVIRIDLSKLEPYIVGPHTPDLARPISAFKEAVVKEGYPNHLMQTLIGSCTNSSYEDMSRAAHVVEQAKAKGLKVASPLWITPGSDSVQATIERDGQMASFNAAGATVLANACGPCIGQWKRDDIKPGDKNSIISSYNRNFTGRNDGNAETLSFIASPELVTAMAFAGELSFNPLTDALKGADGKPFKLEPPQGKELPPGGFATNFTGFVGPDPKNASVTIQVDPKSERLQLLSPFAAWDGKDIPDLLVLLKAKGKCTTDHISAAGKWLRFRGHLDRISDNMFIGANNAFTDKPGTGVNLLTGETGQMLPAIARAYKAKGQGWLAVGDENYGEGSSREHAAMSPRFLGARAVLVRSFARIHEANLKKQGILPLTFADPKDYEKIRHDDRVSLVGVTDLKPGSLITVMLKHSDGTTETFSAKHTISDNQLAWFRAGSALNAMRAV